MKLVYSLVILTILAFPIIVEQHAQMVTINKNYFVIYVLKDAQLALVVIPIGVNPVYLAISFRRENLVKDHVQKNCHLEIKLAIFVVLSVLILDLSTL